MIESPRWWTIVHLVLWQVSWWVAVLGAAKGLFWAGPLAAVAIIAAQAAVLRRDLILTTIPAVGAAALGAVLDTLLAGVGAFRMAGGGAGGIVAAPWMMSLWAVLMTALPCSLRWLRGRPWLAAGFGAVGGPAAYAGGLALGALTPGSLPFAAALALVGVAWFAAMPVLLAIDRFLQPAPAGETGPAGPGCDHA